MPITVLDSTSIDGLLQIAAKEGLLKDKENNDGILLSLCRQGVPDWHKQQILEQVLFNSNIYSAKNLHLDRFEGDFLNLDLLKCPENEQKDLDDPSTVAQLS